MKEILSLNGLQFEKFDNILELYSTRHNSYAIGEKLPHNMFRQFNIDAKCDYNNIRKLQTSWKLVSTIYHIHYVDWGIEENNRLYHEFVDIYYDENPAIYRSDCIVINDKYMAGLFDGDGYLEYIVQCCV